MGYGPITFQMHESLKILLAILTVDWNGVLNIAYFLQRGIISVANPFLNWVHIWRPGRHTPTQNLSIRVPLRGWTAHDVISLICVLEKIFKRKDLDVKQKPFPCQSHHKFWHKSAKRQNSSNARVHRSNVLCPQEIQSRSHDNKNF